MFISAYLILDLCFFPANDHKNVSNPTRPISINKIKTNLPIVVKLGVNPIVNPTVLIQEMTSSKIYSIPYPPGIVSVFNKINAATVEIIIPAPNTKNARLTVSLEKDRLNI